MTRGILFAVASIVAFLIFAVLFVVISVVWDGIYYAIEPNIAFGPLGLVPGPSRDIFRGVEDIVEIVLYVLFILGAIAALVILVTELAANWPFGDKKNDERRGAQTA